MPSTRTIPFQTFFLFHLWTCLWSRTFLTTMRWYWVFTQAITNLSTWPTAYSTQTPSRPITPGTWIIELCKCSSLFYTSKKNLAEYIADIPLTGQSKGPQRNSCISFSLQGLACWYISSFHMQVLMRCLKAWSPQVRSQLVKRLQEDQ